MGQSWDGISRISLGAFPTPIRQVHLPDGNHFWVKDDGVCSDLYGGNKVRKLQYLLADAKAKGTRRLVVHGDIDSHTVHACCVFGRLAGFEVDAVVFPHAGQSFDSPVLTDLANKGVRVHRKKTMLMAVLWAQILGWCKGSYLVPLGASTPLSTLGYVDAALELIEQVRQGFLPQPTRIYIPFATGGSVAGLLIGLALAGVDTRVVAVQTVDRIIANRNRLECLVKRTLPFVESKDRMFDRCMERLEIIDSNFLGKGYRDVPVAVATAVKTAEQHKLLLEPVFSGKALAALLDQVSRAGDQELLFWNTHDQSHQLNSLVSSQ